LSFIQHYLLKGFCLGGIEGLTGSVSMAFYDFMKYAKLWEMQHVKESQAKYLRSATRSGHS